ncbi:MAG: endonuclease NucS domain-containing protein [Cyanobacteriota bacterium]
MLNFAILRKTGKGWEFESEQVLEDFTWANLKQLLGLTPLKRQYAVKGQICDILAVDENKRLVVLELKNSEDRYIIQQLTRYYDALLEEKPFNEVVDYTQSIKLIAITPKIHRDNLIDRKYHHLSIQFLQSEVVVSGERFYLQLKDIDTEKLFHLEIRHQDKDSTERLPTPPKLLQKRLSSCPPEQLKVIMEIRNQILSFDKRMEEISTAGSIKYGNGKSKTSKFCAEFCSDSKGKLLVFLWIPFKAGASQKVGRAKMGINYETGNALIESYVSKGIRTKNLPFNKDTATSIEKIKNKIDNSEILTYEEFKLFDRYTYNYRFIYCSINEMVDTALKYWLKRL